MMSTRTGVRALVMVTLCYGALEIVGLLLLLLLLLLHLQLIYSSPGLSYATVPKPAARHPYLDFRVGTHPPFGLPWLRA